ncbi:hypothetical protein FXO37_29871 [Capsicum annuum]|nr:hypothetical protein FXO37_29871 [Capsicum annuum]
MESTIDSAGAAYDIAYVFIGATYVIAYVYIGAACAITYIYIGTTYAIAYVYIGTAYAIAYAFQWSYLTSSTPSNSSVSVLPPKISPQSISKTSKYIDVNFASQNSAQSAPALSKKFPLSIAERRGSLSKCLKLPMLTGDFERKGGHLKSVANEQGVDNPSDKEVTVFGGFHESWEKKSCNESSSAVLNGVVDTSGASCNLVKPVVYRLGKDASRAVYVWVGRSFSCDFSKVRQVHCKGPGDPGEIDWNQAASVVLHQMVLPIDSNIKFSSVIFLAADSFDMGVPLCFSCYSHKKTRGHRCKPWKQPLEEMQVEVAYNRFLWPDPSLDPGPCAYWELTASSFPFYISRGDACSEFWNILLLLAPKGVAYLGRQCYLEPVAGGRWQVKLDCTIQIERFAMLLEFLVETACYMRGKAEDANAVKENEEPAELLALLSSRLS